MEPLPIIEITETTRETVVVRETTRRVVATGTFRAARPVGPALAKANIREALELTARTQARRLGAA